jgi:hypothetical protein
MTNSKRLTSKSIAFAALFAALAFPGDATAQGGPEASADRGAEAVWVTRLYESFNKNEWRDATLAFNHLRENFPGTMDSRRLVFLNATAHYNLKEKGHETAKSYLETLIGMQEDHIGGLYLLAKIHALSKDQPRDGDRAKDLLLQSARAGQYVLRDINDKEGKKTFGKLTKDSTFILRVMNASNEFQVSATGLRNPFKSPLRTVEGPGDQVDDPGTGTSADDEERRRELEQRVETLFSEIERLAQERQVEELIGKFTELRQIMNEYGEMGSELVKQKKEKWAQRLAAFGEVQLSIQLQIYINEGNQHLRTMAEAIRNEDYDTSLERFELIKELKDQMYAEEREVFHRNAEALFLRGKALADRARRLKKISEFTLDVTGIVVAPPNSDEPDKTIINDRIYEEGDPLIDEATDEEIEGLLVVEIIRSTVRFRYEDTEFVRELKNTQ